MFNFGGNSTPWYLQQQQNPGGGGWGTANNMVRALMGGLAQGGAFKPRQGAPTGWQPAPREGSQNVFQGPPTSGVGPMPQPPTQPPAQTSMVPSMPPQLSSPSTLQPTQGVPFQNMTGPGMNNQSLGQRITSDPRFDQAMSSSFGAPFGGFIGNAFKSMAGGNPFSALFSQPPQG